MMIIQIRGTSGSGKTWVMRKVMDQVGELQIPSLCKGRPGWESQYVEGRKKPLTYRRGLIYICGHYQSNCGGCDNVGSAAAVHELTCNLVGDPCNAKVVLQEGLLLSEDSKWASILAMEHDVRIIYLTTPIDQCVEQIKSRRALVGNEKPLKEDNTRNRVSVIERSRKKLTDLGILCRRCSSTQAPQIILDWIKDAK